MLRATATARKAVTAIQLLMDRKSDVGGRTPADPRPAQRRHCGRRRLWMCRVNARPLSLFVCAQVLVDSRL